MARYYSYVDTTVGLGNTTVQNMLSNGSEYGVTPSVDIVARNITATGNFIGTLTSSDNVFVDLKVTGIATIGIVTGATYFGDGSNLTGISAGIGTDVSVNTIGIITAASFHGDGSNLTGLGTFSGNYNDLSNKPTIPTNNNQLTNGAGYITTSFTNTNQLTNGAGYITNTDNTSGTAGGLSGSPSITVTDLTASGNVSIAGTLTYEDVTNVDSVGLITARSGINVTGGSIVSGANPNLGGNSGVQIVNDGILRVAKASGNIFEAWTTGSSSRTVAFNAAGGASFAATNININKVTNGANLNVRNDATSAEAAIEVYKGGFTTNERKVLINNDGSAYFGGDFGIGASTFPANGTNLKTSDGTIARHILEKTGSNARIFEIGNGGTFLNVYDATADAERLRVDSSGRLLLGTTSNFVRGNLQVIDGGGGEITIGRDDTTVTSGNDIGHLFFASNDENGTGVLVASIDAIADDTHTSSSAPTALTFSTTPVDATSPTERLRIDSSGRFGLGNNSPGSFSSGANTLVVSTNSGNSGITINNDAADQIGSIFFAEGTGANAVGRIRYEHANNAMTFSTNSSQAMVIDSAGRLLVGATSGSYDVEIKKSGTVHFLVGSTNAAGATLLLDGDSNGDGSGSDYASIGHASSGDLEYKNRKASGAHVFTTTSSDTERLRIDSAGDMGLGVTPDNVGSMRTLHIKGPSSEGAAIRLQADGDTPGSSDAQIYKNASALYLRVDGTDPLIAYLNGSERVRINSDGQVLLNHTTSIGTGIVTMDLGGTNKELGIRIRAANSGNHMLHFEDSSGNNVGEIVANASSTSYNTSSDYRLKENVVDLDGAITRVKQLQPKRFNFIADAETTVDGFLAHEAQAVVPEAVTGEKDGEEMQGIDQSKLVPLLTAALQEAIAKIETLEAKVSALESE